MKKKYIYTCIYIIIGGFYDSDNIVLIEVTDPKVYYLFIYYFVYIMNVYAHVSIHVRVCILL